MSCWPACRVSRSRRRPIGRLPIGRRPTGRRPAAGGASYTIGTTTSSTPAAVVLDAAATAIGKQAGTASEPNVDWSEPYFHTVQIATCDGGTTTDNVWQTRTDDGVGESNGGGCGGPGAGGMYSIVAGFADFYGLGNQPLTESQVDQLPTDPHKLWPLLEGFDGDSLNSDTANPHSNASTLYTDSLGRTGTVLHIGIWTMAIDTATGQILSMTQNAIPGVPICGGKVPAHSVCPARRQLDVCVRQRAARRDRAEGGGGHDREFQGPRASGVDGAGARTEALTAAFADHRRPRRPLGTGVGTALSARLLRHCGPL